jgi:hypothetical protein
MNACGDVRVAAVVRQEFYYALRILEELVPAPAAVYEMPVLDLGRFDEDTRRVIMHLDEIAVERVAQSILTNVVPTDGTDIPASAGGRILPLEMQVIGEALNRHFLLNNSIRVTVPLFQRIGGTRNALVRDYFEYYVERSPDRDLAPAVLFALAVAPPPQVLRTDDVCRLTYAFPAAVDGLLQFFERDCGLLRKRGGGYQWVHESLAAMYIDATPTDMPPALPEAIRYHAQHSATGFEYDATHIQPLVQISTAVFTVMIATIAVFFVHALWTSSALEADSYLLAAPAHAAFAVFVYRFVISFVVRLHRTAAIVSWLLLASFGAISIGITIAWPETWIASMGLTGGVIGLTLLSLSRRRRRPLAGKHVGTAGWTFAFLGVTMILAGSAYAALVQANLFGVILPWAGALASLAFVAIAATSTHRYATAGAGATWLSYVERP